MDSGEAASALYGLIDRAKTTDSVGDMLRIMRDLLPAGATTEGARNLRKQVTLLRARLRDAAETERAGLCTEMEARTEEQRLVKLARDIARDVVPAAEPRTLAAAVQSLSLAIQSREPKTGSGPTQVVRSIFLSYRRTDTAPITGVIRQHLVQKFGQEAVFMDVDSIPLGVNFRAHIVSTLAQCKVCLAIIGPNWLGAVDKNGKRRLEDVDDPIRVELETALRIDRRVIPLLVDNAVMPSRDELPEAMRAFSSQNGFPLRPAGDFNPDMTRFLTLLEQML